MVPTLQTWTWPLCLVSFGNIFASSHRRPQEDRRRCSDAESLASSVPMWRKKTVSSLYLVTIATALAPGFRSCGTILASVEERTRSSFSSHTLAPTAAVVCCLIAAAAIVLLQQEALLPHPALQQTPTLVVRGNGVKAKQHSNNSWKRRLSLTRNWSVWTPCCYENLDG